LFVSVQVPGGPASPGDPAIFEEGGYTMSFIFDLMIALFSSHEPVIIIVD
jgi:hypothetical protein